MGKLFAVVVTVIALISVFFFVRHTWWPPTDISATGPAIDRQMDETFVETGILFLAGQLLLGLFAWQASDIGSNRFFTTICATRSDTVGIPSGLSPPPAFGIFTVRTGGGK